MQSKYEDVSEPGYKFKIPMFLQIPILRYVWCMVLMYSSYKQGGGMSPVQIGVEKFVMASE